VLAARRAGSGNLERDRRSIIELADPEEVRRFLDGLCLGLALDRHGRRG
jgi:hypothetical protein